MEQVPVNVKPLQGGVTNHNYVLETDNRKLVIRVSGEGTDEYINRSAELQNAKAMSDLGIGPKIYFCEPETGFMVSEFVEGMTMTAKLFKENERLLEAAADVLKKCHTSGVLFANTFSPVEHIRCNLELLKTKENLKYFEGWDKLYSDFQKLSQDMEKRNIEPAPCHNDTLAGNFLGNENNMRMIDWEYSGNNDLYYDLATFSMENELTDSEEKRFLNFYFNAEEQPDEKRLYENKFLTAFYWSVWSLLQIVYDKDEKFYYQYGERRFEAAKEAWRRLEEL